MKSLLTPTALRRLDGRAYRFCAEPACDVVYFDREAGSVFGKRDLSVRVGLKETCDPIPLCYCFGITVADLDRSIAAIVAAEVRAGHCACEVRNPTGSCCLRTLSAELARRNGSGL